MGSDSVSHDVENSENSEAESPAEDEVMFVEEASEGPSELQVLVEEKARLKDKLLRTAADFDNFRKRARRDIKEAERRGKEDVLREVLPVIDNLERAVASAGQDVELEAIIDGVRMVLKSFEEMGSRIELNRIATIGLRFDPNLHDAIQQQETTEHEAGSIVAEVVPGYLLGEKLLRPAMVVVARAPAVAAAEVAPGGSEPPAEAPETE